MRFVLVCAAFTLGGCGNPADGMPNPANDFDCSLATYLFHETSAKVDTEHPETLRALSVVHDWYATLVQEAVAKGASMPSDEGASKIMLALGRDLPNAREVLAGCVERTKSNPRFTGFATAHGYR